MLLSHLSDQELLSMLLGNDIAAEYHGCSLVDVFGLSARKHSVRENEATYMAAPIIGAAKELIQRAMSEQASKVAFELTSPALVHDYLRLSMSNLQYEVFTVLFLDTRNCLIEASEMFRGTLNQTSVYPREVVKKALQVNASAVILAHNHPSGNKNPSSADERLTKILKDALALVDVRILDHVIVAGTEKPFSFAEHGLML